MLQSSPGTLSLQCQSRSLVVLSVLGCGMLDSGFKRLVLLLVTPGEFPWRECTLFLAGRCIIPCTSPMAAKITIDNVPFTDTRRDQCY